MDDERIESIESAFKRAATNCLECECGVVYWDNYNNGYDWAPGQREDLAASEKAVACDHSIGIVSLEGRQFADACACWHERAIRIANWLDGNSESVAEYYRCEKRRLLSASNAIPIIEF